jgi:hypothetical protein
VVSIVGPRLYYACLSDAGLTLAALLSKPRTKPGGSHLGSKNLSENGVFMNRGYSSSILLGALAAIFGVLMAANAYAFGPCTDRVPDGLSYLPSVQACGGRAAIVVYGKFRNSFSAVVRDCNNDDRDPCNKGPQSCGSNFSSPYKAQSIVPVRLQRVGSTRVQAGRLFCLKERGDSEVYKLVRRMTIKLVDPVRKPSDVAKVCLKTRTRAVRPVRIVDVAPARSIASTGFSAVCESQRYLACNISYERICPRYS